MTAAVARVHPSDLDVLWERSEPDLELDEDGRIRSIPVESPARRGSGLGAAAPAAIGAVVASVARWD